MEKWIKFVNRSDWIPTNNSVLCVKHFKEEFISKGKRNNLKWSLHPVPTIHSDEVMKRPSCLPNTNVSRKAPTDRNFQEDELRSFISADTIRSFDDLDEKCCPRSFQFKKNEKYVWIFRIDFEEGNFPSLKECVRIDRELHVQLQYCGHHIPLPKWFVYGQNAKLTRFSMLIIFFSLYSKCYQ